MTLHRQMYEYVCGQAGRDAYLPGADSDFAECRSTIAPLRAGSASVLGHRLLPTLVERIECPIRHFLAWLACVWLGLVVIRWLQIFPSIEVIPPFWTALLIATLSAARWAYNSSYYAIVSPGSSLDIIHDTAMIAVVLAYPAWFLSEILGSRWPLAILLGWTCLVIFKNAFLEERGFRKVLLERYHEGKLLYCLGIYLGSFLLTTPWWALFGFWAIVISQRVLHWQGVAPAITFSPWLGVVWAFFVGIFGQLSNALEFRLKPQYFALRGSFRTGLQRALSCAISSILVFGPIGYVGGWEWWQWLTFGVAVGIWFGFSRGMIAGTTAEDRIVYSQDASLRIAAAYGILALLATVAAMTTSNILSDLGVSGMLQRACILAAIVGSVTAALAILASLRHVAVRHLVETVRTSGEDAVFCLTRGRVVMAN